MTAASPATSRPVLAGGSVLDSEDAASVNAFRQSHGALLDTLAPRFGWVR